METFPYQLPHSLTLQNEGMMKMMGAFTVKRMTSMMGTAGLKAPTKEQMIELNRALNQIDR